MIEIYTKSYCPYCWRAKDLLASRGVEFTEIDVGEDSQRWDEMYIRSGGTTVPQIFINDHHIGGCDDLFELAKGKKLDVLLGEE